MSNKNKIIQELDLLGAKKLTEIIDSKETPVDRNYLSKSKEEILSIINIPVVENEAPSKGYLEASKNRILKEIEQPKVRVVSLKKWWRPLSAVASAAILLTIGINIIDTQEPVTIDVTDIETNEILEYLDESLLDLESEALYTEVLSDFDLEIELSDDEAMIDLIYDEISLEAIQEYY